MKKIYALAINAVRSVIELLKAQADVENLSELFDADLPVDFETWLKLPTFATLKVSLFNLIRNNELPTLMDMYYTYRYSHALLHSRCFFLFCFVFFFCNSIEVNEAIGCAKRDSNIITTITFEFWCRPPLLLTNIVPPFSKVGFVLDGGHFITFDGKYFSMPGDCTYILAQDMLDGNFSVVANFNKGTLASVTITEPKESITLKNNAVSLFPLIS